MISSIPRDECGQQFLHDGMTKNSMHRITLMKNRSLFSFFFCAKAFPGLLKPAPWWVVTPCRWRVGFYLLPEPGLWAAARRSYPQSPVFLFLSTKWPCHHRWFPCGVVWPRCATWWTTYKQHTLNNNWVWYTIHLYQSCSIYHLYKWDQRQRSIHASQDSHAIILEHYGNWPAVSVKPSVLGKNHGNHIWKPKSWRILIRFEYLLGIL